MYSSKNEIWQGVPLRAQLKREGDFQHTDIVVQMTVLNLDCLNSQILFPKTQNITKQNSRYFSQFSLVSFWDQEIRSVHLS